MKRFLTVSLIVLLGATAGARAEQTKPLAMEPLFQANPTDAADLAAQTRVLPTVDRDAVMFAATAALQDMGFAITGGERRFGLLVASKHAEVEGAGVGHAIAEGAVVATTVVLSLLTGQDMVADLPEQIAQEVHVSILVTPSRMPVGTEVRISLDRDMLYDQGYSIPDHTELPLVYEEFFERLSKAVFLEGELL